MTEAEWLSCTDPLAMLDFLRGKTSDRKLRLYFCGGCRSIAHLFFEPASLAAVEVAEQFADGAASREELRRCEWAAECPTFGYDFDEDFVKRYPENYTDVVPRLVEMGALAPSVLTGGEWRVNEEVKRRLIAAASLAEFCAANSPAESEWGLRHIPQVDWPGRWLFDCVFGDPFRPVTINPRWLIWHRGIVQDLARGIYEEREFKRLPILADALEEAGCTNADILNHCRQPGEHVRGCWVVDLLLGKS